MNIYNGVQNCRWMLWSVDSAILSQTPRYQKQVSRYAMTR